MKSSVVRNEKCATVSLINRLILLGLCFCLCVFYVISSLGILLLLSCWTCPYVQYMIKPTNRNPHCKVAFPGIHKLDISLKYRMLFVSLQQQNDIKTNIDINGKFKWHLFCPGVKPIIDKIKLTQQVWNQSEVGGDFTCIGKKFTFKCFIAVFFGSLYLL